MNGKTGFGSLLPMPGIHQPTELESWRDWLVSTMIFFALFAFPLAMLTAFPIFIEEKLYELMALDVGIYLIIVFRFFVKGGTYKGRGYLWIALLYGMAISYHVTLGPLYARPAWLVMAAVMVALLFGTRAAAVATLFNTAILMILYWSMSSESTVWVDVYREPFGKWIMFVVNCSILTLASSLPVGFLLKRLDSSLKNERDARENLSMETRKLQAAYDALQRETEERKGAQKALKASEEKFRNLVENVNEGIYSIDESGVFTYVNPALERILGDGAPEIIGRPFTDFIYGEDLGRLKDRFKKLLTGQIGSDEYRVVNKAGEIRWIRSSTRPVFSQGKLKNLEGVLFDITERKEAEKQLVETQQRYQSLFDSKTAFVFVMDDRGHFVEANDLALELFGYTREEISELNYFELLHPDQSLEPITRALKEIQETGAQEELLEIKLISRTGKTLYIQSGGTLIPGTNEIIGVARDITDQKKGKEEREKLEDQLVQAQKMEAVGTLAGGIAHDFNNALQGVLGYAEILLLGTEEDAPEAKKLRQIKAVALRASELTQQLLTFSRRVESNLRPVDLNHEVRQVEKLLRRTIPRMIDIELRLQDDLGIVDADAGQIEQVLMNLGVNARDAMPEGGRLRIETENVVLDEAYCRTHLGIVPGDYVMLSLSDNGIGMNKETLDHIFEPFYTTKDPDKGTGLGLSMVYGIVKNHGGHITCDSQPGEGTIFRIHFPVIEEDLARGADQQDRAEIRGGTETILLVDDEDYILEIGEEMLRRFGYRVLTARDAETALEIYREQKASISLIILDLIMPGMGGRKCLEEIMEIDPSQRVVIASGYAADGALGEAMQKGARGYIKKPYNLVPMVRAVREVLDQD